MANGAHVATHDDDSTESEHRDHVEQLFERLQQYGISINSAKCVFNKPVVKFLGHLIDKNGVSSLPDKIMTNDMKYIFTMVDQFSRWPEAVPILNIVAQTVVASWIRGFGTPKTIDVRCTSHFRNTRPISWLNDYVV